MEFRTSVVIGRPTFQIEPLEEMLFVGSCFADSIGQRFAEERFAATVNPYGTMYNPASVLHTIERYLAEHESYCPRTVFMTLGTNHVYRLKETGEIVDNCQKRPQRLFDEERLSIDECADYLRQAINLLTARNQDVNVVLTVSPIRYQKYGFHESQLSKATLLLAVEQVIGSSGRDTVDVRRDSSRPHAANGGRDTSRPYYFPAYEIVLDELRDYRFYKEDMLHPSAQAVEYIWQQLVEYYLSPSAKQFIKEWKPIKEALGHRPFHPESEEYKLFLADARQREKELLRRFTSCR